MKTKIEILRRLYRNRYVNRTSFNIAQLNSSELQLLKELKENSIKIIPNFISKVVAEKMRTKLDSEFAKFNNEELIKIYNQISQDKSLKNGLKTKDGYKIWADKNQSDKRIIDAQVLSNEFNDYFTNTSLINIGSAFINNKISPKFAMANRTDYIENNLGSGGGWHRDQNYKFGFKGLVYLSDVEPENGPFQLIPKSSSAMFHLMKTNTVDKYQFTHNEVMDVAGGGNNIITACGKAGTLVIFDTNCIHRGKPIEAGTRYAVTNYYSET